MIWLLLACSGATGPAPTPAPVLAEASSRITFGTMEALGSHVLEASLRQETRRGLDPPRGALRTFRLRWRDLDNWSAERAQDGTPTEAMRVVGGRAWSSDGDARWRDAGDAEPLRVQLAHTWDLWQVATELFPDRVLLTPEGVGEVEGRPVRTYTLSLGPAVAGTRRVWEPTELRGSVWLDETTAVRLLADLHGEATSGDQTRVVELKLAVHGIGLAVNVESPDSAPSIVPDAP